MIKLPGWKINIDEFRPGYIKVTVKDKFGHEAEVADSASEETISKAISHAFDIEKQISENWSLFLYDFYLLNLSENEIFINEYHDEVFGFWHIEKDNKRIVYNEKDSFLNFEIKSSKNLVERIFNKKTWSTVEMYDKQNLDYFKAIRLKSKICNN